MILLDLRMPVMDGWAFRKEQRADPGIADIPVIVLSGADAERVSELEAAAAFRKPVSFADVMTVVRQSVRRSAALTGPSKLGPYTSGKLGRPATA